MALSNYYKQQQQQKLPAPVEEVDDELVKFTSSESREIPTWPSNSVHKPSDLYRTVLQNSRHPPLMQYKTWNLAVPYREQRFAHTPSESIANHFTPTAAELKLKLMPATKKFEPSSKSSASAPGSSSFQQAFTKKDEATCRRRQLEPGRLG